MVCMVHQIFDKFAMFNEIANLTHCALMAYQSSWVI